MRHTYFWVKIGWVPPYLAVFRHFSQNFANFANFYKCFTLFKGQKIVFFPKVNQIWSSTRKKIKNSSSSFFKKGGGGGGSNPRWQMSSFFYFFLMKASLIYPNLFCPKTRGLNASSGKSNRYYPLTPLPGTVVYW